MDLTPILAAGGIVGLFGAAGLLVVQLLRANADLRKERDGIIKEQSRDIAELKAENLACKWQVNGLVNVLRQNGLEIPEWLFRGGFNGS